MFENVKIQTGTRTDGRWLDNHPISSPRVPSAQVSLKTGILHGHVSTNDLSADQESSQTVFSIVIIPLALNV